MTDPLTTPALLEQMARDLPDHPAIVGQDRSLSFAQLHETVRDAAAAMIALGVGTGERVAVWSPNSWHWVVSALGVHYAGAVLVPVNAAFTAEETSDVLARSRARLLLGADAFQGVDRMADLDLVALPDLRHIVRIPAEQPGTGETRWEFLSGPRASDSQVDGRAAVVRPDDIADILFTSGTTGRSKGVLCSHRQTVSAATACASSRGMTSADRYLGMAPFFTSYGYRDGVLGCLQSGATLVPTRSFDPEQVMRLIADRRITVMGGPPTLFQALLDHPARQDYDLGSLRVLGTGGATVPVALVKRILRELKPRHVRQGYGLTECCGIATAHGLDDDPLTIATTCGRPTAGFDVRISGQDGDGVGEVLLRGPNVMLGYLDDPVATAEAIDADGWLHTGDLGSLDAAGNLRITGRIKDMYICGGHNVYPAEVEQILARLDGVADSAVIGVAHDRLGEVGRAFVVPRPGADLDAQQIITSLRNQLAAFKIPRSVIVLDQLPRNAGGKVLKSALRETHYCAPAPATPAGLGGPPVGAAENWVADAWQLVLNIARPGRRDRFTDLGGDSLAAIEFSQLMDTRFGVDMPVDALAELPTIADIVAALRPDGRRRRQAVVRLRTSDTGPVCLLVPGIGGHAWTFAAAAAAMTAPCDLLAISLTALRDGAEGQPIRDQIRSAAHAALTDPAAAARSIMIGGYSFGSLIATDLTGWLLEQGIPVAKLLLLDPDPLESTPRDWSADTLHKPKGVLTLEPGSPAARQLAREVSDVAELVRRNYLDGSVRLPQVPTSWLQTTMMADEHADSPSLFGTPVATIDRTVVDLDHLDLIRIPHVGHLAGWLDGQLAGATGR